MTAVDGLLLTFRDALLGQRLNHIWRGVGSAIFFEFGELTETTRRNGSNGQPDGTFGLMIEWSWRIEGLSSVICGSWSDEELWQPAFKLLMGSTVTDIATFGRLPEISLSLSNDRHIASFMTSDGDPSWALFDRRYDPVRTIHAQRGLIVEEH